MVGWGGVRWGARLRCQQPALQMRIAPVAGAGVQLALVCIPFTPVTSAISVPPTPTPPPDPTRPHPTLTPRRLPAGRPLPLLQGSPAQQVSFRHAGMGAGLLCTPAEPGPGPSRQPPGLNAALQVQCPLPSRWKLLQRSQLRHHVLAGGLATPMPGLRSWEQQLAAAWPRSVCVHSVADMNT